MNKNSYVEATLLTATHPHISKHTNLSSILISCVLIVCGIASVWVSLDVEEVSSTYSMLLLTLGAFFCCMPCSVCSGVPKRKYIH